MIHTGFRFFLTGTFLIGFLAAISAHEALGRTVRGPFVQEEPVEAPAEEPEPVPEPPSVEKDPFGAPDTKPDTAKKPDDKKTGDAGETDEPPVKKEDPPLHPRQVLLNLRDGSVITGKLTIDKITVATEFGELIVPIDKIQSFTPGLDSHPELGAKVADLIEKLGSDDYKVREETHKVLAKMGPSVRAELARRKDDENAERKRHIQQLLAQFDEMAEDEEDEFGEEGGGAKAWIRDDTVVTTEFTIVGKIAPTKFQVESKYGPLAVQLGDIRMGEREIATIEAISRKISVPGTNLVQKSFKSSGIRVEKGDKITVRADGQIVMTPWGSNYISTPDGGPNFGWYVANEIYGGALVAKIGSGKVMKVGSKATIVAKTSGTLQFAIAMQQQYGSGSYSFPGQYNVRIKVEKP